MDGIMHPTGIAVAADGLTAWVVDAETNRVSVWTRPDAASTDGTDDQSGRSSEGGSS